MRTRGPGTVLVLALATASCSGAAKQLQQEDEARTLTPVPACVVRLPSRKVQSGTARALREEQYWQVVLPGYDQEKRSVPDDASTCTGRRVFHDPAFDGAKRMHPYPDPVTEEDILLGSGGDRLKVVWLRTHIGADGKLVGPLALVRAKESVAEVYAVGAYHAITNRPYFVIERMGNEALVTVQDDACTGVKPNVPCENRVSVFVARKGRLLNLGVFPTERRDFATGYEPGAPGTIEYRLNATLSYVPSGIKVFEQVVARDPEGRELRKAEVERVFAFSEVKLVTDEESLWARVYPKR